MMSRFTLLAFLPIVGIASMLALNACTPMKVRLGMKVYLDKTPITSIAAGLPKGPGIAPGEKSPLVLIVTEPDGKVLQTEGAGHGKFLWKDLHVTATAVTANQKGVVSLPHDPRKSEGKVGHVTITVPSHPDLRAELDIPVRYNYAFTSNFSGSSGSSGMNGSDGMAGSSGSMGSTDPNNPSAGGQGGERPQWPRGGGWRPWRRRATSAGPSRTQIRESSPPSSERICSRQAEAVPGRSPGRFADGEEIGRA